MTMTGEAVLEDEWMEFNILTPEQCILILPLTPPRPCSSGTIPLFHFLNPQCDWFQREIISNLLGCLLACASASPTRCGFRNLETAHRPPPRARRDWHAGEHFWVFPSRQNPTVVLWIVQDLKWWPTGASTLGPRQPSLCLRGGACAPHHRYINVFTSIPITSHWQVNQTWDNRVWFCFMV